MVLMIFAPSSFAQSAKKQDSSDNVIDIIKPYVEVSDEGELQFKNVPEDIYNNYDLADLQKHFDELNALAQEGSIVINEDLSIDNNAITPMTVYGSWTYYWWGYDRYFNHEQTVAAINYYNTVAAGGAITTGLTFWLPPVSGLTAATSGYYYLLATRFAANDLGYGVYAAVTWAAVFNIEPL